MTTSSIIYRPLTSLADFAAVEEVQRAIWSADGMVPRALIKVMAQNGGAVIGAFDGPTLIGFVLSFLGTDDQGDTRRPAMANLKHCSHMLAVLPPYQSHGVAYQLKLLQRDFALQQGVRLVTWTFDPLVARNARFNVARLGAMCRTYIPDMYGPMNDALNAGLPSDRLLAEWWLNSPRVREKLSGGRAALNLDSYLSAEACLLNPSQAAPDDGLPRPTERVSQPDGLFALVEIPADFQALRAYDAQLALAWRAQTHPVFISALAAGYIVTDFVLEPYEGRLRGFYALSLSE